MADHLGSNKLETDAAGTPTCRNAYAPFGKRTEIQSGGMNRSARHRSV